MVDITGPIVNMVNEIVQYIPVIIAALIILLIGWIIGRVVGSVLRKLFVKANIDKAINKTEVGEAVAGTGMSTTDLFTNVVKWFIYLIFILAAVSVLNIPVFTNFINQVVLYIPNLIAGILILLIGLLGINWIMNWIKDMLQSQKVAFANIITTGLQAILSLVVIVIALDQLRISTQIIYTFLVPLAWGVGIGLAIALGLAFGLGGKEVAGDYLRKIAKTGESKKDEIKDKAENAEDMAADLQDKTEIGEEEKEEFREPGESRGNVKKADKKSGE